MDFALAAPKSMPAAPNAAPHSTVTVIQEDTIGALMLGTLAVVLLIAYLRSEARQRRARA